MSLLIATPMYGGQCHTQHFKSCMALKEDLLRAGVEHDWLVLTNESLITRARNVCAREFLRTDYAKMIFIDADIEFNANDVALLWNLQESVACGAYRMKTPGAPLCVWRDGKLVEFESDDPVETDYAGTGFMMVDRSVFEQMKAHVPEYREGCGDARVMDDSEEEGPSRLFAEYRTTWGFFQDVIADGIHLSEDYFFCRTWRQMGGSIWMHPGCKLTHWGQCGY